MSKAARMLKLALNNSSKDEATTAFRQAFSYADREGVRLCDLHVIREETGSCSPSRERELVDKYNWALGRAKRLQEENDALEKKLRLLKSYVKRL